MTENEISKAVIGAAIEVHKILGPGLLESTVVKNYRNKLGVLGVSLATFAVYCLTAESREKR